MPRKKIITHDGKVLTHDGQVVLTPSFFCNSLCSYPTTHFQLRGDDQPVSDFFWQWGRQSPTFDIYTGMNSNCTWTRAFYDVDAGGTLITPVWPPVDPNEAMVPTADKVVPTQCSDVLIQAFGDTFQDSLIHLGRWAKYAVQGSPVVTEGSNGLTMELPYGCRYQHVSRAPLALTASGNIFIYAKVEILHTAAPTPPTTNHFSVGIAVTADSGAPYGGCHLVWAEFGDNDGYVLTNDYNSTQHGYATGVVLQGGISSIEFIIQRVGTTITKRYAINGGAFVTWYTTTSSASHGGDYAFISSYTRGDVGCEITSRVTEFRILDGTAPDLDEGRGA